MVETALYPRFAEARLLEALADSPAVLVHGPRQSGKTTLARMVCEPRGYAYVSFDEGVAREGAQTDPAGFVADLPERAVLDEVQHVPAIFSALKAAIDRERTPGRFVLTGSANVLLVPRLSDSLAGRMEIIRLHPLAQCELVWREPRFLDALFGEGFRTSVGERLGAELAERVVAGGYPAALARAPGRRRSAWYQGYLETIVQRDVRDLARIQSLDALPRLLALAAGQTARLLNLTEFASALQLSRPTTRDYVGLLERVFLVDVVAPWHSNRLSRLVKTPKLHVGDTGLGCALLGAGARTLAANRPPLGQLLETVRLPGAETAGELARGATRLLPLPRQRRRRGRRRDRAGRRRGRRGRGQGVGDGAPAADFRGLRKLRAAAGDRFAGGVVLYDGAATVPFGDGLHAVPIRALWEAHEPRLPRVGRRGGRARVARRARLGRSARARARRRRRRGGSDAVLRDRLRAALARLNPDSAAEAPARRATKVLADPRRRRSSRRNRRASPACWWRASRSSTAPPTADRRRAGPR